MVDRKDVGVAKVEARSVRRSSVLRPEERGRQVTRLLDLLRALEASRRGLTVQELIEQLELGCSERTVYRDLEHLKTAGFSIALDGSRYRVEGKTLQGDALRASQVFALLVASDLMTPLRGFPVERELLRLIDSLRARLSPEGRSWLDVLRTTALASAQHVVQHVPTSVVVALEEALGVEQLLELDYAAPNKAVEKRLVEPHLLWCNGSRPYLVGFCRKAQDFRTFALQRIARARLLEETFERRVEFDPARYTSEAFGTYRGPVHEIVVRFEPGVAHLARERLWHSSQSLDATSDGAVLLSMTAGGLPEIAAWVAGFGGEVRALQPFELRHRVRELHRMGLQAHQEDSPGELTSDVRGSA